MNDKPSAGVKILVTESFGLLGQFKSQVSWGEDMKCRWGSVLDDKGWLLGFSDDSAKSGELFRNGFYVTKEVL